MDSSSIMLSLIYYKWRYARISISHFLCLEFPNSSESKCDQTFLFEIFMLKCSFSSSCKPFITKMDCLLYYYQYINVHHIYVQMAFLSIRACSEIYTLALLSPCEAHYSSQSLFFPLPICICSTHGCFFKFNN